MMFGIDSLYIWLAVIIISVAVEAFTLTLCGIWFAAGGVAALIAASLSVGLMGQWIVFIVFSALLLVLVRPLCRRFLGSRQQATNADHIIGQTAVVTEPIDNVLETGAVKINGKIWTARSTTDAQIAIGTRVTVVEIRGVKAIVKPNQL